MTLQEMIKKISDESGLGEEEIMARINEKRDELSDLITLEGAAHIVAQELGLNLFKGEPKTHDLKVENVIPGMTSVDIVGKVVKVYPVKEFNKKNGSTGVIGSLILGDDSGTIRVVFWDKGASLLAEGRVKEDDVIRIKNAHTKANQNGEAEIHINSNSKIIANPTEVESSEIQVQRRTEKIGDINSEASGVDILCKVMRIFDAKEFEREGKTKGRVANLIVADETGNARLVLWDDAVGLLDRGEVKAGDTIRIDQGYVKMRNGEPEINIGKYGKVVLNPPEELKLPSPEATLKELRVLKHGDVAKIRGALVEIYEPKVFKRKNGSRGLVANAAIDDGTACMRAAFYDKQAEALLDAEFKDEDGIEERIASSVNERKAKILGVEVIATVDVRHNDFSGQDELVVQEMVINPDPKEIIKKLLEEAKIVEGR